MADDEVPFVDYVDEDEDSPTLIDRGLHTTETIDLKGMLAELDQGFGAPDKEGFESTSFGKLMEALPIPALLIGDSGNISFMNQSCEKISPEYQTLQGSAFNTLFPDSEAAEKVEDLVDLVFQTRKTQIIEAVMKIAQRRIWGRAHLRSLRYGVDASILVLVEDLTLEKTQLVLQKNLRKELEKRVEQRTADLAKINKQLQGEIAERKRAQKELNKHREQLQDLVAERTTELNTTINRLKQEVRERKQVEKSLRSSESRLNVAFRANPAAVSIDTLAEGRYLEVNDSFCRLTGYAREEVVGKTVYELKTWSRPGDRDQMVRKLLSDGAVQEYETLYRTKEGQNRVVSLSAEVIELDSQPHVLIISTDITERKAAQAEHDRLITAIEQVAESIIITDAKGTIRYVNPALEAKSGYTRKEVLGKHISLLRSPENDKKVFMDATTALNEGRAWKGHMINKKKSRERYEVETTISPVKGQTSRVLNYVIVERDVTNEVRLERQLRQAQKMEAIGTLAGGIAHDFNNILGAMLGYTHLAKEQLPVGGAVSKDLDEVIKAGERAKEVINQVLTFSRKADQERRPVEVHLVFKEALNLLRASIPTTIEMKKEIESAGWVMADPTQMHQVLMNLCTNAYQSIEGGHGALSVTLQSTELDLETAQSVHAEMRPGPYVKLSVSDTGSGIPPEIVDRIFEPYFTTKDQGKGTGLGLATVHGIINSHGGRIKVISEQGQGTTIDVYLPKCGPPADKAEKGEQKTASETVHRILVVDDEIQLANIAKRILESQGYEVTVCNGSHQALDVFKSDPERFSLVITDYTMPVMTGLELGQEMLKINAALPVIMCTGYSEALSADSVKEAGLKDFLIKPISPDALTESVRKILKKKPE
jgi:PAS domain S-box-containing protein